MLKDNYIKSNLSNSIGTLPAMTFDIYSTTMWYSAIYVINWHEFFVYSWKLFFPALSLPLCLSLCLSFAFLLVFMNEKTSLEFMVFKGLCSDEKLFKAENWILAEKNKLKPIKISNVEIHTFKKLTSHHRCKFELIGNKKKWSNERSVKRSERYKFDEKQCQYITQYCSF